MPDGKKDSLIKFNHTWESKRDLHLLATHNEHSVASEVRKAIKAHLKGNEKLLRRLRRAAAKREAENI